MEARQLRCDIEVILKEIGRIANRYPLYMREDIREELWAKWLELDATVSNIRTEEGMLNNGRRSWVKKALWNASVDWIRRYKRAHRVEDALSNLNKRRDGRFPKNGYWD